MNLTIRNKRMWALGLNAAFALLIPASLGATPISNIVVSNMSFSDQAVTNNGRSQERRSANLGTSPVNVVGNVATFTNHFAWFQAFRVEPGGPTVANIYLNQVAYDLTFAVGVASNVNYDLELDSLVRGYRTAFLESTASTGLVQSGGTNFAVKFAVDGGSFNNIPGFISTFSGGLTTDNTADGMAVHQLQDTSSNDVDLGNFTGSHTFTLRFTTSPSPNMTSVISNNSTGESAIRFGLNPTSNYFTSLSETPSSELPNLGHFLTVTATFDQAVTPVPEPSSMLLLASALLMVGAAGARQARRTTLSPPRWRRFFRSPS